jgi:mono/diheme cytochrome c family protein
VVKAIESKAKHNIFVKLLLDKAAQQVDGATKALDETPGVVESAKAEFEAASIAYRSESVFSGFANPQDYLDKIDKDQNEIKIEKRIEEAKASKAKKAEQTADRELQELRRLKNLAQNFLETRDALATANATLRVFAPEGLKNAQARLAQLQSSSEGELLFEYNCARCHTKGWTYFTPENARVPLPAPQGTGAFGPNLANGDVVRQFVDRTSQVNFIAAGSIFQAQYGARGIGSGRMPAFNGTAGRVLDDSQIDAIVTYEREGLSAGKENSLGVKNLGSGTLTESKGK